MTLQFFSSTSFCSSSSSRCRCSAWRVAFSLTSLPSSFPPSLLLLPLSVHLYSPPSLLLFLLLFLQLHHHLLHFVCCYFPSLKSPLQPSLLSFPLFLPFSPSPPLLLFLLFLQLHHDLLLHLFCYFFVSSFASTSTSSPTSSVSPLLGSWECLRVACGEMRRLAGD